MVMFYYGGNNKPAFVTHFLLSVFPFPPLGIIDNYKSRESEKPVISTIPWQTGRYRSQGHHILLWPHDKLYQ